MLPFCTMHFELCSLNRICSARCHYQNEIKCNAVKIFRISYIYTYIHTKDDAFMCEPNHGFEMPIWSLLNVEKKATLLLSFDGFNFAKSLNSSPHSFVILPSNSEWWKLSINRSKWNISRFMKKKKKEKYKIWLISFNCKKKFFFHFDVLELIGYFAPFRWHKNITHARLIELLFKLECPLNLYLGPKRNEMHK